MPYPHLHEAIQDTGILLLNPGRSPVFHANTADASLQVWFKNSVYDREVMYITAGQTGTVNLGPMLRQFENLLYVRAYNPVDLKSAYSYKIYLDPNELPVISIGDIRIHAGESPLAGGEVPQHGVFHHVVYWFSVS
ncbi:MULTISPECIES: hypothetical protein [Rhodomicrobium]|uniref:hypothetical protein n=1 Tax=Rhodomicrobium TaxID=1068 RepID=UPI000F7376D5|nr:MULTISPECIES: hypothetical protein [Rhodomicrobium]